MQEISGSLSEVIRAYSDHNLLVPAATDVQLNPFYKYHVEEVAVDLSENSGDIYKVNRMDTLKAEVNGDAAQAAISDAMSALTTEGAEFSVTAEGVKVDLSNVEVDSESATAQIEAALGMESGTLAANDITVTSGATVTIPQELVNVDTSGIQSATESQTETEPVETDTTANVNITDATTDASGAKEQAQSEVESTFSESMPADGHTDVTLDQTNNADIILNHCYLGFLAPGR